MITLFRANQISPLKDLKQIVAKQIRQITHQVSSVGNVPMILRYEFQCEPIDILTWLHNQDTDDKIYWADRNNKFEIGGLGIADMIQGEGNPNHKDIFEYMEDRLSADNPHLRYFGGLCFQNAPRDHAWKKMRNYRFHIPQFEILKTSDETIFAFNVAINDVHNENIERILKDLDKISFSRETTYRNVPRLKTRKDFPNEKSWKDLFTDITDSAGNLQYDKIVLARKSVFEFDIEIKPIALIKHLRDMTPNCFHFCFQLSNFYGFVGATPERLYKRYGMHIETEALAGTTTRSHDLFEDQRLSKELLNSEKNSNEHQYVVDEIKKTLLNLCTSFEAEKKFSILKLDNGQHLITRFQGELKSKIYDDEIIKSLHPTPAVAGVPREQVVSKIQEVEPFDRGWYAGPVGYVGYDHSEFAVAIRSGLIEKKQLSLFAGAGIVKGSKAEDEWSEIENKIGSFIKVFNN